MGPAIAELIGQQGYYVCSSKILPDEEEDLYQEMVRLADEEKVDVIFTTGGTGLSPRDNTPEATLRAATKNVPGIAEAIRAYSMRITPRAMLSRAVSVMRGQTLDHQFTRKSQGSEGKSGISSSIPSPWNPDHEGRSRRVRQKGIEDE